LPAAHTDSLILGASGTLGQFLCRNLLGKGEAISGTFFSSQPSLDGIAFHRADAASDEPASLIRRSRPAKVFHLSWSTNLDECERNPELAYGPAREGLKGVLQACKETGSHLIFMSSDGIFGDPECERFEDSAPCPINHYGRGKVEAENAIRASDIAWTVMRACPLGFNRHHNRGLVNWAIHSLKEGKKVAGFADSSFTPLSAATLARMLASIGADDSGKILHFVSAPPITKYDFLRAAARILGVSEEHVSKGHLSDAKFEAPRPRRQDLQTRRPKERSFPIEEELRLSLQR
jgi:dTDP-4-dehydrorhamnose reductase